ncbi:MAG TPA: 30S ribosomal protein S4 [Candidatus Norongarragalinales archaeon]|nr:30S ribosomal protein S4 [Candidatus Norongarragalinales archaeon]
MGAKRLRKSYEKPKKLWEKTRIETESKLRQEYGLKNAREVWKMQTILRKIRREARRLLSGKGTDLEQRTRQLVARIQRFLVKKEQLSLDDVLSLTIRDILERRLQTVVYKRHLAKTMRQARQFISHGHIAVKGTKISSPSYLVKFDEEIAVEWYGHAIKVDALPKEKGAKAQEPMGAGISEPSEIKEAKPSEN